MAKQPTSADSLEKTLENLKKKNSTQREKIKALEAYGKKMKEKSAECEERVNMACNNLEDMLTSAYIKNTLELKDGFDLEKAQLRNYFIKIIIAVFFLGFAVGGILVTATI